MTLLNEADAIRLGSIGVDAVYVGDVLVWPPDIDPGLSLNEEQMADGPLALYRNSGTGLQGELVTDHSGNGRALQVWDPDGIWVTPETSLDLSDPTDDATRLVGGGNNWDPAGVISDALNLQAAVSLSFLMKPDAIGSGSFYDVVRRGYVWGTEISGVDKMIRGRLTIGGVAYHTGVAGGREALGPSEVLQADEIYHICFTWDGALSRCSVYINGVLDSLWRGLTDNMRLDDGGGSFVIGTFSAAPSGFFGVIDEVAVYNHALTAERALAHYEASVRVIP